MTEFANRTAIITGASQGIGAATAQHLASLGMHVVLAARNEQALETLTNTITSDGGQASYQKTDVADNASVEKLIARAMDQTGRIDLLLNNAGLIDPIARLGDSDPDAWSYVVDVNLKGVYYGVRHVLPHMAAQGSGTIINISSGAATNVLEGWSHYCATKAAVLSLTRMIHKEYGDKGIRAIGLSPGTVATEMQVQIKDSGINPVSQLDPSVHIPADWVAQTVAYLMRADADSYLGTDFSMKTNEGRAAVGLPPVT